MTAEIPIGTLFIKVPDLIKKLGETELLASMTNEQLQQIKLHMAIEIDRREAKTTIGPHEC